MSNRFDVLDPNHMKGVFEVQVLDADLDPNLALEYGRDWQIKVDWTLTGVGLQGQQDVKALGGDWRIRAVAESCGDGPEQDIADVTLPMATTAPASPRSYTTTLTIPGAELPEGAYEITVLLTYSNLGTPLRMAAYAEAGIVQIYKYC
jgi:hypothetical protein